MSGAPVVKGTRVPIEVILYRLKEGNSVDTIHEMYFWIDKRVLAGAIEEAIQTLIATLHGKKILQI
jgi:uncharacterized protein (DUF433 family)